jgi:hypothetical protein
MVNSDRLSFFWCYGVLGLLKVYQGRQNVLTKGYQGHREYMFNKDFDFQITNSSFGVC